MKIKSNAKILLFSFIVVLFLTSPLFSLIPPLDFQANANEEMVYLGGSPIGISLHSEGLLVVDYKVIITDTGNYFPAKEAGILVGDLITSIDGKRVNSPEDLQNALGNAPKVLNILLLRKDKEIKLNCKSIFDPLVGAPKLGLIINNEINGMGTLTYAQKNKQFCSLGHKISNNIDNTSSIFNKGNLFSANVLGVYKGNDNEAGALKGTFDKQSSPIGTISKNTDFGVYGTLNENYDLNSLELIPKGSMKEIQLGKAYMYTTIKGLRPEKYEIEIVKTISQSAPAVKSMVIRIKDKRLIDECGGIVQGMSGSPIVQNGKLIGAVTHVFLNDATLGFGIYVDWLN